MLNIISEMQNESIYEVRVNKLINHGLKPDLDITERERETDLQTGNTQSRLSCQFGACASILKYIKLSGTDSVFKKQTMVIFRHIYYSILSQ